MHVTRNFLRIAFPALFRALAVSQNGTRLTSTSDNFPISWDNFTRRSAVHLCGLANESSKLSVYTIPDYGIDNEKEKDHLIT